MAPDDGLHQLVAADDVDAQVDGLLGRLDVGQEPPGWQKKNRTDVLPSRCGPTRLPTGHAPEAAGFMGERAADPVAALDAVEEILAGHGLVREENDVAHPPVLGVATPAVTVEIIAPQTTQHFGAECADEEANQSIRVGRIHCDSVRTNQPPRGFFRFKTTRRV